MPEDAAKARELHIAAVEVLRPNVDLISNLALFKTQAVALLLPENFGMSDDSARVPDEVCVYPARAHTHTHTHTLAL